MKDQNIRALEDDMLLCRERDTHCRLAIDSRSNGTLTSVYLSPVGAAHLRSWLNEWLKEHAKKRRVKR